MHRGRPPGSDILWQASFGAASFAERVEAASTAGYAAISASVHDADGECPPEQLAAWAADRGVGIEVLDGAMEWYPHDPPKHPLGGRPNGDVLAAATHLGVQTLSALAPYPTSAPLEALTESFAHLCEAATEAGIDRVHLEFTPFPPVPDLATAWRIVEGAGHPAGGVLLDAWHFFHSDPDLDLLARIPGERIMAVQLSDGTRRPDDGSKAYRARLLKDTFAHRDLPGAGTFDLPGMLRVLQRTGGLNRVGPEVLSDELFGLPPTAAAQRMAASTAAVFAATFPDGGLRQ